jgi:CHAD domain-containing protein
MLRAARAALSISAVIELRESLRSQVSALRSHAPHVAADGDPEELHDVRVAVRRLRSLLRGARPLIDDERAEPLRRELGVLGKRLGPARDGDVFAAYVGSETDGLDEPGSERLLARVDAERRAAYDDARAALDDDAFARLLEELEAFAADVVVSDRRPRELMGPEAKRLRRAMDDVSTDEALHRARIKAKRLRYAAEVAGADGVVRSAKRFQDAVGEHQDAVVAEQRLRDLAEPETALLVGRLIERQASRRIAARADAAKAWKKLAKKT